MLVGNLGSDDVKAQVPPARPRAVFISLSQLMDDFAANRVPQAVLDDAIFLFGSKRMWIWPANPGQVYIFLLVFNPVNLILFCLSGLRWKLIAATTSI